MKQFLSSEVASKENKWQGRNVTRWQSPEYDKLYAQSEVEIDPVKRAAMLIALNDMVIRNVVVIPSYLRTSRTGDYYARRGRPQLAIVVCSGPRLGPRNWATRTVWFASPHV